MRAALSLARAWLLAVWAPALATAQEGRRDVVLATTTSLYETGLLDSLALRFERATGLRLRVVAVGSGQALKLGERGDADVILAHSPEAERRFVASGAGLERRIVAWNYFVIVGPPDDPAGVRQAPSATAALARIALSEAPFASRGDSSGTHLRELALWRAAGGLSRWPGYLEVGQGMAATLLVASERRAYALSDQSSFLALARRLELVELVSADSQLINPYHVIPVNPLGRPGVNAAGAQAFADFLVSRAAQALIAGFGRERFGRALFTPALAEESEPQPPALNPSPGTPISVIRR